MRKAIVVTGASKGIGAAAARRLAADGWSVIGVARTAPHTFDGEFIECDLADADATAALCALLSRRRDIVGVVNNVGAAKVEKVGEVDPARFAAVLDFNLRPTLQLTQALLGNMRAAGFGRIVNVSSLVVRGLPYRTSYAAAKAAVESLTRSFAVELAGEGITANSVAPGPIETELFRSNNPAGGEAEARYLAQIPMGRLGRPEEVGAAIAFLCSDAAGFITGQIISVDGGASLGRS